MVWTYLLVLIALSLFARFLFFRAARSAFGIALGNIPGPTRMSRAILATGSLSILSLLGATIPGDAGGMFLLPSALLLASFLILLLWSRLTGRHRSAALQRQPAWVRRAYGEAMAALSEKRPEEGLQRVEKDLPRHPSNPWLLTARGTCLTFLGRLEEARADLQAAIRDGPRFPITLHQLGAVELLLGEAKSARRTAEELILAAPRDPLAWDLLGLASLDEGEMRAAEASYRRAHALKEKDASALAGMALAALEEPGRYSEAERWIAAAREMEPGHPLVLLARARLGRSRGEREEAGKLFLQSLERLKAMGFQVWIPFYQALARRLGLAAEPDPSQGRASLIRAADPSRAR